MRQVHEEQRNQQQEHNNTRHAHATSDNNMSHMCYNYLNSKSKQQKHSPCCADVFGCVEDETHVHVLHLARLVLVPTRLSIATIARQQSTSQMPSTLTGSLYKYMHHQVAWE